jgi:pyrroloquinoline quinone (PQQ) biosynthesis protein C
MNVEMKKFTEPIFAQLAVFGAELAQHPLLTAAQDGELSETILYQFAFYQFSDSILWIPMLAQMKSKAERSRRLRQAIEDNIAHEAGLAGISHVTLAVALMRSLGLTSVDGFPASTFSRSASLWLSDEFERFTEPEIAGWLLTAETLVPRMFAAFQPAFARLACDGRYFTEHVTIDTDEHATWMAEAVEDVIDVYGPRCIPEIEAGMTDAFHETLEVPDELWRLRCASL